MSEVRVVSDSGGDSVFDSSGDSRPVQGDGPSGTSTPDQSDAEGGETVTVRLSPIKQRKSYKTTPSVKRKMRNTSTHTPSPATSKHVKRRAKRVDVVSIVSESSGEGDGLLQAQQLLKIHTKYMHRLPPTIIHNTRSRHKSTQRIAVTTVGCVQVGGGGGVRFLGGRARRGPCHSYRQGGGRHPVPEPRPMV